MTNEEALDILERQLECANGNCPEPRISCIECPYNVDAIDYNRACKMAIEALSKQCASSEQADKKLFGHGYWIVPGEVFISHNVLNDVLGQSAENDEDGATDDQCGDDTEMVDQFRDDTKKTEDVPDIRVGKTDFKPGDKFILELGQERRMFDEYEIVGTDLYVKTDLLEKLKRYEPISLESAIDYLHEVGWLQEHDRVLTEHSQPEKIPYKKPEIIHCGDCRWYKKSHYCGANYPAPDDFCSWAERRNDG